MSVLDQLNDLERARLQELVDEAEASIKDLKILTYRDGRRLIGWRSPLAKKWTSDGYEELMEISRGQEKEDAPVLLTPEMNAYLFLRHEDGAETCVRVDPEGNFSTWRTQIVEPSSALTLNGSDDTN